MVNRAAVDDAAPAPGRKLRIVIVGGGAAGLELAARLGARYGRKECDVALVERNRTHIWKPLLHEVATGSLDANLDETDYLCHSRSWGYRYLFGTMTGIDRAARKIRLAPIIDNHGQEIASFQTIDYDYLVLAHGSVTNDFGTPGVAENCFFLDGREQADAFREQLLNQAIRVSRTLAANPASDARLRIAIVGGGATGVELAAELHNAAHALGAYGLGDFGRDRLEVTLIEAGPRILPALPERLAHAAQRELEVLGVRVRTALPVTASHAGGLTTQGGEEIAADLQVWAAGVKAAPVCDGLADLELARNGQIVVRPTLQSVSDDHVFAAGDCAYCLLPGHERPIPPRAQAAHQMAAVVLKNLSRMIAGRPLVDFVYHDHGSLVSISRFSTVGTLMGNLVGGRMAVEGRLARFVYRSLYRMHLLAIHGWFKGAAMIAVGHVNRIVRPRLKLH